MPKKRCAYRPCRAYHDKGVSNGVNSWCCDEHQYKHAMENAAKLRKAREKKEKSESQRKKREFYAKDIKTRREAAIYWFNRFIRLRDAGSPCISCGNRNPNIKYDAGHFVPAGRCAALRFDERNVHLQCSLACNQHLSGNRSSYRASLIEKLGEAVVRELEGPQPTIKITAEWYKSIEDKYKAKCKEIEKERATQ